ncbi:hypothetical protein BN59_00405 [Legionella massiliensis]|uniref:Uncharacterized protein n=1 Tax=Legionella massiliensis TaxID=1034943 RepID=A0A078KWL3_9GAMM|nr:hypothetical protein [Legionella massiliensis]CDZ76139.1 hypothetical protein BN59_00405 [Legionella massiliensis]CEE11877.1 hypothetical protein BN1094_00405 [Legionella massiliensis]
MAFDDVLIDSGILQQYIDYFVQLHQKHPLALKYIEQFWLKGDAASEDSPLSGRLFFSNFYIDNDAVGEELAPLIVNNLLCSTKQQIDICMNLYMSTPADERLKCLPAQIVKVFHFFVTFSMEMTDWRTLWNTLSLDGKTVDSERNKKLCDFVIQQIAFGIAPIIQDHIKRRESGYYLGFKTIENMKQLRKLNSHEIKCPALIRLNDGQDGTAFYLLKSIKSGPILLKNLDKSTPCNANEQPDLWVNSAENQAIYKAIDPLLNTSKNGKKATFFYYANSLSSSDSQSPRVTAQYTG